MMKVNESPSQQTLCAGFSAQTWVAKDSSHEQAMLFFWEIAMVIRWVVKHTEEINTFSQFMSLEEKGNLELSLIWSCQDFLCLASTILLLVKLQEEGAQ